MKIFITRKIVDTGIELLREQGYQVEIWDKDFPMPYDLLLEKAKTVDGLICMLSDNIDKHLLDSCPDLKVISNYAVGFNNIDINHATSQKLPIGNTPDVLTDATADLALTLLLTVSRKIIPSYNSIAMGEWKTWEPLGFLGPSLAKKTIGIVGMGRIGYAFASKCHLAFDMDVIYTSRTPKKQAEENLNAQKVDFNTLLKRSDFISVHTGLTNETANLFNADAFKQMKESAIFINTGRGGIHDEPALIEALERKEIWGAGLDVTNPEPMDKNSKLLSMPNVVITPHIGSATHEARSEMSIICAQNIIAGINKKTLPGFVNPNCY